MNELIIDQELQRLLNGSLTAEERHLLLQYAEEHPTNWRTIALAFVEEQVLIGELRDVTAPGPSASPSALNQSSDSSFSGWNHWLAIAAVICLILGAGVLAHRASVSLSEKSSVDKPPDNYIVVISPAAPMVDNQSANPTQRSLFSPLLDKQSLEVIREYGYTAIEHPVIYIVQGERGEQYVLPHHNLSLIAQSK